MQPWSKRRIAVYLASRDAAWYAAQPIPEALIDSISKASLEPTEREKDVLRALAGGLNLDEAAASLYISRDTAKTRLARVKIRLRAASTGQAIAIAARQGLIGAQ